MKNRFWIKPTEDDIKEIGAIFNLQDAVIALDALDVREVMDGADNTILLCGKATGNNRCADAIEDAVLHTCGVAREFDLFRANKILLYIISPKNSPMLMSEMESVNTFIQMFPPDTQCRWGLGEKENINETKIVIVASNLKEKS